MDCKLTIRIKDCVDLYKNNPTGDNTIKGILIIKNGIAYIELD